LVFFLIQRPQWKSRIDIDLGDASHLFDDDDVDIPNPGQPDAGTTGSEFDGDLDGAEGEDEDEDENGGLGDINDGSDEDTLGDERKHHKSIKKVRLDILSFMDHH
jgi:hypothetical protein